ncbi:MAG TPA: DUF2288 domain-containing protein [Porticoccaceae bacterium]
MQSDDRALQRAKILSETARIPWRELQRFFASGAVVAVAAGLDLVEVACAMAEDDGERVAAWMGAGQVVPASDGQARDWYEADRMMWAVVLSPFVLVQPIEE